MTQETVRPNHKNIFSALASAQMEMGPVVKGSTNPHFKSKYADLADVVSVAIPALTANGIALFHQPVKVDGEAFMRTVLAHGESGTEIACDVPLIAAGNNMQAFKSATTYAKRIGVESLTGIAPEDDDGTAVASAPPAEKPAQGAAKPIPKDVDARQLYGALVEDMRRCDLPADMDAWWTDSECVEKRATLPADWKANLAAEFKAHKIELIAKVEKDQQIPFA